jgi:Ni/Fe-hydrogenase subunit HybB-like protein
MMANAQQLFRRLAPFQWWVSGLAALMAVGATAGLIVFAKGLSVTHLNDLVPWGLWIAIDLSSIAMGAGAFMLCAAVYLLGLKQFQPLARTATFIGLIGYSMAMLCLLLDIGRPDRFWQALVYWNTHSLLWEATMCLSLYVCVLVMEVAPMLGQADWFARRWPKLAAPLVRLHHFAPVFAVIGLCLSMLHQSSLGAMYGTLKAHPIWYKPDLSVLFMLSAMIAGPSLTLFATMVVGRVSRKVVIDDALVQKLAHFIGWVLAAYLYFRFWDSLAMTYTYLPGRTEGLALLTSGALSFNFWFGEILLGAVIPVILLLTPRFRRIPWLRMLALGFAAAGVAAYRWDTNMAGQMVMLTYLPQEIVARYTQYFPSLIEFLAAAGIIAYGMMAFTLGVRFLNVVDHRAEAAHHEVHAAEPQLAMVVVSNQ